MTFVLALLFRWLHILAAILAGGGTLFMRLAVVPSAAKLSDDEHARLKDLLRGAWAKWVHISITFLLISGLYNIVMIEKGKLIPKAYSGAYHGLLGLKLMLALGIFYIASMLMGRSEAAQKFRANAKQWLSINSVLIVALVLISGTLRVLREPAPAETPAGVTEALKSDSAKDAPKPEAQGPTDAGK